MAPPTVDTTSSNYQDLPIIINGAGLVGCMAALYMAQHHGQKVVLIDKRQDYRSHKYEGRSINLAISHRAFKALGGIDQEFVKHFKDESVGLKMQGRGLHMKDLKSDSHEDQFGKTSKVGFQPYGIGSDEYIVSVGRHHLNCFLLEELEKRFSNVLQVEFEANPTKIEYAKIDKENVSILHYKNKDGELKSVTGKFIIGADGLNSFVRQQMQINPNCRFSSSQTYISHAYKELSIRPNAQTGDYVMRSDCLHIWPRGDFMLIALPNPTKDFTVTLFMRQYKKRDYGEDESVANNQPSFESVELGSCKSYDELTPEMKETNVRKFFSEQFPDAYEMVKSYIMEDWNGNPTSSLSYIQCNPHHYDNKLVLLGDSAHAIIPFYGQGVNCGFEDCHAFSNIIKEEQSKRGMKPTSFNSELIGAVFENYSLTRKASADAILNLSLHNFIVMRSKTADPLFLLEQAVMRFLHKNFPQVNAFKPLYTMVAFTPQKTYADAWNTHVNRENVISKIKQYAVQTVAACAISAISVGIYSKFCRSATPPPVIVDANTGAPSITEQTIQLTYSLYDASKGVAKSISGYFGY